MGIHFLSFWPCGPSFPFILAFSGSASGPPPTSCQKWPVCPTSLQWIYQRRDRLHFAVFSILGLHFLAFWPCGPSFPCILALWAFISLHFGLVGLHFLSFWLFRGRLLGPPPQVAKNGPFAQRPYNGFISAVTGPILQFLAFWAFISLDFGLVGLHFLAFWPCGPSFPCILALWAFISFHFGLFGVGFWGPPPTSCQKRPVFPMSHIKNLAAPGPASFSNFGLLGLHFLSFWPFGPSSCIWQYPGESNPGEYLYVYASMHYVCTISTLYLHSKLRQQKLAAYITRPGSKEAYPPAKSKVHTQKG